MRNILKMQSVNLSSVMGSSMKSAFSTGRDISGTLMLVIPRCDAMLSKMENPHIWIVPI